MIISRVSTSGECHCEELVWSFVHCVRAETARCHWAKLLNMPPSIPFCGTIIFEQGQCKTRGVPSPHPQGTGSLLQRFSILNRHQNPLKNSFNNTGQSADSNWIGLKWSLGISIFQSPSPRPRDSNAHGGLLIQGSALWFGYTATAWGSAGLLGWREVSHTIHWVNPHKPPNDKSLRTWWPNQRGRVPNTGV